MFFPFKHVKVDRGRMIHVPHKEQQRNLHVDKPHADNAILRNHINVLETEKQHLHQAYHRQSRELADLKKRLEKSERDRATVTRKYRDLGAKFNSKEQAYNHLYVQYDMLREENRSLRRCLQQPHRQPPRRRH